MMAVIAEGRNFDRVDTVADAISKGPPVLCPLTVGDIDRLISGERREQQAQELKPKDHFDRVAEILKKDAARLFKWTKYNKERELARQEKIKARAEWRKKKKENLEEAKQEFKIQKSSLESLEAKVAEMEGNTREKYTGGTSACL